MLQDRAKVLTFFSSFTGDKYFFKKEGPFVFLCLVSIILWYFGDTNGEQILYGGLLMNSFPGFLKKSPEKLETFQWIDHLPLPSFVVQANDSKILAINDEGVKLLGINPDHKAPILLSDFLHGGMHIEDWMKFINESPGKHCCSLSGYSKLHFAVNVSWRNISVEPDSLLLCQFSEIQRLSIVRHNHLTELAPDDASDRLSHSLSPNPFSILEGILSNYPVALCITSPDGGYCWHKTKQVEDLFGVWLHENQTIPRWWEESLLPEEASRVSLLWNELAITGKIEAIIKVKRKKGGYKEVAWTAISERDQKGNPTLVYHYFIEKAGGSPSSWSPIVNALEKEKSGIAKWAWDRKGGKVEWSPEFYKLHHLSRQDQPDLSLPFPYMSENSRFDLKLLLETMSDSHLPLSTEYKVRLPDGTDKDFVLVVGEVITGSTGVTEFLSGIIQDVSSDKEQHRLQLELTDELSRLKQLIKEFSTALSHRLRVPVAQLQGILSIILNQGGISRDKQLEYLAECADELDNSLHEMNDLLNTDKEIDGVSESFSWQEIWKPIALEFQNKIIEIRASLMVDFSAAVKVIGIKENLQGILGELLNNALRFRDNSKLLELQVHTEVIGSVVWFHMQDNGLGIDLKGRETAPFELYKRFHSDRSGKGFGLHLVKLWVEALNGEVAITSIPGEGTRVSFGIPYEVN